MLLAFVSYMNSEFFQLDVKSAFLSGYIMKEAYVEQFPCFENKNFSTYDIS